MKFSDATLTAEEVESIENSVESVYVEDSLSLEMPVLKYQQDPNDKYSSKTVTKPTPSFITFKRGVSSLWKHDIKLDLFIGHLETLVKKKIQYAASQIMHENTY